MTISYSSLPLDLQRCIFELAALASLHDISKLMLVEHQVKVWIEPILYRVLVLAEPHRDPRGSSRDFHFVTVSQWDIKKPLKSKSHEFFQSAVKSLRIYDPIDSDNMKLLFTAFAGVTNVAIHWNAATGVLPALEKLHGLRRLRSALTPLFLGHDRCEFTHALFRNLTHLYLADDWRNMGPMAPGFWKGLGKAPSLTHIAFDSIPTGEQVAEILSVGRLRCIIFWVFGLEEQCRELDVRIVHITRHPVRYWLAWNFGASPQDDRWTDEQLRDEWQLAEEFIAAKQRGTIAGSQRVISDLDVPDLWPRGCDE
ncbi:hypothetical protein C8R47DRAFT_1227015 [Mycena vitilis]|nr:hypothetical protein C8R47DRAFT_1230980 [Mycena vitilis]KAJ6458377.1 hypothetical protein C8R47DRAFT_1227015 [Mycena vitilis]